MGFIEYNKGKIKSKKLYDGKKLRSEYNIADNNQALLKFYQGNKIVHGKGKVDNEGREIGWWSFFDEHKKLLNKEHMVVIDNHEFVNQNIAYNSKGEIDILNSHYVDFEFRKSDSPFTYNGSLKYNPKNAETYQVYICFSEELKDDFSNVEKVKLDTIVPKGQNKEFTIVFADNKKHILKGFVVERYSDDMISDKNGMIDFKEIKTFFNGAVVE